MEKEPQPESMATVTMKADYAPSEYSSEPPPAYQKPKSASVQIAKIVAVTVVFTAVILGGFILASAYVSSNATCKQLEQELELLNDAADRLQGFPQPEALIQDEPNHSTKRHTPLKSVESNNIDDDSNSNDSDSDSDSSSSSDEEQDQEQKPAPTQFNLEQLASHLLEKNQKTKMNCIVEKKRAEEVVDHKPKMIRLPFGLNLTTDPRVEILSGERMVIVCESGSIRSAQPPQPEVIPVAPQQQHQPEEEEDPNSSEEDTIMIQPVMIPIPQSQYPTHMAQRLPPPPPPQFFQNPPPRPAMGIMQIQIQPQHEEIPQRQSQPDFPPNPILRHIVQQIIANKIMEAQKAREEQMRQQEIEVPHRFQIPSQQQQQQQQQPLPLPEEVLTQLNRLPNRDVIVAVSSESNEDSSEEQQQPQQDVRPMPQDLRPMPQEIRLIQRQMNSEPQEMPPQIMRFVQEQRQNAADMNGKQMYAVRPMPAQMMTQDVQVEESAQEGNESEQEGRPHFLQPRSVA